jgi:YesN/AraC family two-component response regulator
MIRQNIERYLREHYAEDLSMQMVAKAMNYSDAYFCKLFKQCFHANFSTWLNEFRVQQAKALLSDTQMSIQEVSRACGYADANYFARIFRRVTGKTPTQYRMQ